MVSEVKPTKEQSREDEALDLYLTALLAGNSPDSACQEPEQILSLHTNNLEQPETGRSSTFDKPAADVRKTGSSLPAENPDPEMDQQQIRQSESQSSELKLLTLKVGGLTLTTPLSALCGAISYPGTISTLPEQPDWFLGLFQHNGAKIAIADMGKLVNHGRQNYTRSLSLQPYSTVLLLKGGKWAVTCDEIGEVIRPLNDEIRWREQREKIPWLLGTVISPPAALIDMRSLIPI